MRVLIRFIVSLVGYLVTLFICWNITESRYRKMLRINSMKSYLLPTNYKMTFSMVFTVALLFTVYNMIVTSTLEGLVSDRYNYSLSFYGIRKAETEGLAFMIDVVHKFSSNVNSLFYTSMFLTVSLVLLAYSISEDAEPKALFFMLTTNFIFQTFVAMKQCYANGFSAVAIILALRNKKPFDNILSISCIFLAILFHPCSYFLIPVFIMLKMKKNKAVVFIFFVSAVFTLFFFKPLILKISQIAIRFIPILSTKIGRYITENTTGDYYSGIVKGIPYYVITLTGWIKRKKLMNKICNYDNYFLLSILLSFAFFASIYNRWISRLAYMLYLPVGIFFVKLMHYEKNKDNRVILNFAVI